MNPTVPNSAAFGNLNLLQNFDGIVYLQRVSGRKYSDG